MLYLREGSNFATTSAGDPASEAASFFIRFHQDEHNDFCPIDFWGTGGPYVDFLGYSMPQGYVDLLAIFKEHGDFTQGVLLGRSAREHFLKLPNCVLNDIQHNFLDTISIERILQWRATIQDLIKIGFAV